MGRLKRGATPLELSDIVMGSTALFVMLNALAHPCITKERKPMRIVYGTANTHVNGRRYNMRT